MSEPAAPLRVLLVEDSADDAELISRVLRSGGLVIDVRVVDTEAPMRAQLSALSPDIILADGVPPGFVTIRTEDGATSDFQVAFADRAAGAFVYEPAEARSRDGRQGDRTVPAPLIVAGPHPRSPVPVTGEPARARRPSRPHGLE